MSRNLFQQNLQFLKAYRIKHIHCAPYHPVKWISREVYEDFHRGHEGSETASVKPKLENFLAEISLHTTCHTVRSPASLFLQRDQQTRLQLLKPTRKNQVLVQQAGQVQHHDSCSRFSRGPEDYGKEFQSRREVDFWCCCSEPEAINLSHTDRHR